MKNNKWNKVPLKDFPNGWTPEGAAIIKRDNYLKRYILSFEWENRDDFKNSDSKGQHEFIGKFYNMIGQPCGALQNIDDFIYHLINPEAL